MKKSKLHNLSKIFNLINKKVIKIKQEKKWDEGKLKRNVKPVRVEFMCQVSNSVIKNYCVNVEWNFGIKNKQKKLNVLT